MSAPLETLITIDTSTPMGSVGVARGGEVLAYRLPLAGREQASGIVPSISAVLDDARVDPREVVGVLVGRGPGSFTGVRVAVATARGLAKGLGVPLWPYSSLAVAAASHGAEIVVTPGGSGVVADRSDEGGAPRAVWVLFDARGDRVYAACYALSPGRIQILVPPTAATVGEVLAVELPVDAAYCGDGALRHADALLAAGHAVLPFPTGLPTPHGLLRLHALRSGDGVDPPPSRWEPDYLRGEWGSRPAKSTGSPA